LCDIHVEKGASGREVLMMKRMLIFFVLAFLFVAGQTFLPQTARAGIDWKIIRDLEIKDTPLDVSSSADGQWLFILTPRKILVYSFRKGDILYCFCQEKK
jgi:hypothetical protein